MKANRLIKGFKSLIVMALALTMAAGYAIPTAYAVNPYSEVPAEQVGYRHNGGRDYEIEKPMGSGVWKRVYCLDPHKAYDDRANKNMNYRWEINFLDNAWILDHIENGVPNKDDHGVNGSTEPNSGQLNRLASILWYAEKLGASIDDTQNAVWYFVTQGGDDNYSANVSKYNNYVVKAAGDNGWNVPSSYKLYLYVGDTQSNYNQWWNTQAMVRFETSEPITPPTPPEPPKWNFSTTVNVDGKDSTADAPAVIKLGPGQTEKNLAILDKIQYQDMQTEAGHLFWTMTRVMRLNDDGTSEPPEELIKRDGDGNIVADNSWRSLGTGDPMPLNEEYWINNAQTVIDTSGAGEWAFENSTGTWKTLGPGTYYIDMKLYDSTTGQSITISGKGDNKETFIVEAGASLSTTVTVDGSTADKESPAQVTVPTNGTTMDVVDKIDYKGLDAGATYKVSGSLWEVEDGKTLGDAPVATASEEKVAEDTDGNWEIIFKNVKLEPNKIYVVFETAKLVKDAEGNAVEDGEEIKHENPEDQAQTIVTNEGGTPGLKVMTKVKNQYISPAKNQSVTDIVTFEGLDAEKTYTIKGVIKNQKDGSDVAAECEPLEVTADLDEAGMQFYGIDASGFKDGDKLVVFEYLYEGTIEETKDFTPGDGNEVASHEDLTDVAQTVTIVDGQIKLEKTTDVTSAKPGDVIPYTIAVTNERKVPVTVQIVDNPEAGLEFVEANKNGVFDREVGTIVWDNLEVPANGTVEVMAYFEIAKDANGKVINRAHVFEPDNSDNVLGVYEDDSIVDVLGEYSPSEEGGNGSKPDAKGSSKKTVDTGDENPMALAVITLLLAGGAFVVMRRRRTNQ